MLLKLSMRKKTKTKTDKESRRVLKEDVINLNCNLGSAAFSIQLARKSHTCIEIRWISHTMFLCNVPIILAYGKNPIVLKISTSAFALPVWFISFTACSYGYLVEKFSPS